MPVPPELATCLIECACRLRSQVSGYQDVDFLKTSTNLYVDFNCVARVSHFAAGMGAHDILQHRGSFRRRRHIDEFMEDLGPLFRYELDSNLYNMDLIACLLQDCHGIVLDADSWDSFKQHVLQRVWNDDDDATSLLSFAGSFASGDKAGIPFSQTDSKTSNSLESSERPFKRRSLSWTSNAGSESSGSSRCNHPFVERDWDVGSLSSQHSSLGSGSWIPAPTIAVQSRELDDEHETNKVLSHQVHLLEKLLEERNQTIKDQRKIIKALKVRTSRQASTMSKLSLSMRKQKSKDMEFCPSRVSTLRTSQRQCRRLEKGRIEQFLEHDDDDNGHDGDTGWFSAQGCIALAIRRNLSNISAEDLGLVVMQDVSKHTVLRAECRTGAALLMNSRNFFQEWLHHDSCGGESSTSFLFVQYRQDATNSSKHRQKMSALEIDASFAVCTDEEMSDLTPSDMSRIRRLADIQPVHKGYETGVATMALTKKMLQSIGCPTWDHFLDEHDNDNDEKLGRCTVYY